MAKSDIFAGVDIGTTKVCATIAEVHDDGRIDVVGASSVPCGGVRKGVVVDMESTVQAITDSVEKAQRMYGYDIRSVTVGVTGEHISSLNSRGVVAVTHPRREIIRDDVDRVVDESRVIVLPPDREIIHAIPRGFSVDGQDGIRDPIGMSGARLEVETHIVTGASTFLQNISKCVNRAGLEIEEMALAQLATAEAVVLPAEKELGVAMVDIGGGSTDIGVFAGGEIYYSSVVPVGGGHVTFDIGALLRASIEESERVKVRYGCALMNMVDDDDSFEILRLGADEVSVLPRREVLVKLIEPRMEEIFQMVKQEIIKSGYDDMLPAGVVLTGGGSLLSGTIELAESVLGMPIRTGVPQGFGGLVDVVNSPIYATSVGLIRYAARSQAAIREEARSSGLMSSTFGRLRKMFKG
ncbi:MAG: cell division protein FtsA [Armatimonadota bacterium]|nr:cell division protein FtsA [Armatimonadota bacterium]